MLDARAPGPVSFDGTVVTEDGVVSPLTGLRAAALCVRLLARRAPGRHPITGDRLALGGGGGAEVFTRICDFWYGTNVTIADAEGHEIVVATAGISLRTASTDPGGTPLGPAPPPELAALVASVEGLVCYRESAILHGDRVRLQAMVYPTGPGRWETRADTRQVILQLLGPARRARPRVS